jgi:hypothetical protein
VDTPYPKISKNKDVLQFVLNGGRLEKPNDCPEALYQIILSTWAEKPQDRPSFAVLLKDLLELAGSENEPTSQSLPSNSFYAITDGKNYNYTQEEKKYNNV